MRAESAIVDIAREFLAVHRELRRIAQHEAAGTLRFDQLRDFVGDDERSVLFRLKERCHGLFRGDSAGAPLEIGASALFDLAVGSLFHEAMKLRENLYQADVYAPKVAALRATGVADASGLLGEFDKLVSSARVRLAESVAESRVLLGQTTAQFRVLLRSHAANGLLARFVVENAAWLAETFGSDEDDALADLHGSAAAAWRRAAWSYLESGFFAETSRALEMAEARGDHSPELARERAFAAGMSAYLAGRYDAAFRGIAAWLDAAPASGELRLAPLAASAMAGARKLVASDAGLSERARVLEERLRGLGSAAPARA
ncbi:MAG TPA: hypothetical protein VII78_01915 [Myxococcota bacterium]|jgi:hypothetical protein